MTDVVDWPATLPPTDIVLHPVYGVRRGPRTLTGVEQRVASDAGYWRVVYRGVPLHPQVLTAMRALQARGRGGAATFRLPVWDAGRGARTGRGRGAYGVEHADGSVYSDGTGYVQGVNGSAVVAAAAAVRSTVLDVVVPSPEVLVEAGMLVGVGDRLHVIEHAGPVGGAVRLSIWPTLRAAVAAGTEVNLDTPTVLARLTGDDTFDLPLERLRFGRADVAFEEVL